MDVQDHKKTPAAGGHEGHGVHVCHKCGWPFPNPHPSAKHRRAHKRVCGKVEGYKIIDSETDHISDDDHLSDDDNMKNQSPKVEKESVKELGRSDGIGLKSIKSEDDVFSDAVTEFSNSGITPTIEERLEKVRQLDKSVGEELVNELNDSQLSEDHGTDETTKQPDDFITGWEISNVEAVGSVINPLVSTKPISDSRVEASFAVHQTDGQQINSSTCMFETISEDINANSESGKQKQTISFKPETIIEVKESVNEVESLTEALLSKSAGEARLSESKSEEPDRKVSDAATMESKLHEADGNISHAVAGDKIVECEKEPSNKSEAEMKNFSTVVEIVEQKKELSNVLQPEMTKHNLSPQVEHLKCIDASVCTQVEANSAKDAIGVGHEESAEVYDLKEGEDKEADITSVAETLPALENPEIITGNLKDYEVLRSSFPLDVVDAEVNRSVEDENKVNPNSASSVAGGSLGTSHSDFNSLDDSLEEGVLASAGGEVDTSGFTVISGDGSGTNGLKGSPGTSGFETQKSQPNYSIEGFQPNSATEESSRDGVSAPSLIEHSDMIRAVSSVDEETCRQTTNLSNFETSDDTANAKINHVMTENGTNHSWDEDKASKCKRCTDEVYVETSHGIEIGKSTEVQRSGAAVGVDPDFSPEGHSITSGNQRKSTAAVSQLEPEGHGVVSEVDSKDSEEAAALFVTSTTSNQSTATVEDKITRDAVTSELLPDEGDDKLTKGSFNVSAVDSSRTESLDGNWGSVSVVSTQSDGTALTDAETLSSAGTQAPEKSEGTVLKPQTANQECHPDKSEDSEPPSFMTLVESGIGDDKKVAASEIHDVQKTEQPKSEALQASWFDVQKTEQPKSEALQASWFPSLANVVNESEGRKKNEEITAKVTNWSTGKQRSPLKNLLSEAHAETKVKSISEKQDPPVNQGNETASKNNGAAVTTVSAIIGSETPGDNTVKKEMEKEWNSPARYPVEIKKEKRKGKPYWVPFVCCTSVHQDM